jgi:hypothetical protein
LEFTKNEALNYYDRSNKIKLVYNTVDCDVFKSEGNKNENLVISAAGSLNQERIRTKGFEVFI